MKAIILAGGEGTRLRPLTYKIPKALIPVQGKTLTEHVFDIYKKAGVTEIYLSIFYLANKMREYFGDGSKFGLKIEYLEEQERMGTAGPLLILKRQGLTIAEDFFMCNGDNLFSINQVDFLNFHQNHGGVATIALKEIDDISSRGVVDINNGRIKFFVEKPKPEEAPSNLINSGYYVFSPKIFDYINPNSDFLMLEKDIFPLLAKEGRLWGYHQEAQWFDTGTIERYQQVEVEWQGV